VAIELRKDTTRTPTRLICAEGNMGRSDSASFCSVRRSRRPHGTPRNFMHENRETSETPAAQPGCRTAGEGSGHTARMHVPEESHSGILPMNQSNKDRKPSEAKLTEGDFRNADKRVLLAYRDFSDVFDARQLPQAGKSYASDQLLRNVLAAHALQCSFCVLIDVQRADLANAWYAVMRCIKPVELRTKMRICTWQEIAEVATPRLRKFLTAKYGFKTIGSLSRRN